MADRFTWTAARKIAWREARASSAKFIFVIFAVAVGVSSLTGVRGFSNSFRTLLLREARTLMAADLSARSFSFPTPDQIAVMDDLERRDVERTWVTETVTMMASDSTADPLLVSVKAVEPELYPFYGDLRFEPAGAIRQILGPETIAVSTDLLVRLQVDVGDSVGLGGQEFRIAAVVTAEPDRMAGSLNVGPRVLMTRDGLERTGLIRVGSRASQRFLFRLGPQSPGVEETRRILQEAFPAAQVLDFRQTHPTITRGLDRATMFLTMVSLIALIVGALGVAAAMHAHLQQKMDTIAVMKCLGARSGQIVRIYLMQTLALGLLGGLAGVGLGVGIQQVFPLFIARYIDLQPGMVWDWPSAVQGLTLGLAATVLFTLPPLLSVRSIRPGVILRREMAESRPSWRQRWRNSRISVVTGVLILCGTGLAAAWLSGRRLEEALRIGAYFAGGLLVSFVVLAAVARLSLRFVKTFLRATTWKLPSGVRHGLANLYRPGNQAEAVLVALGIGVMFTLSTYLLQRSMLVEIVNSAPPGMPNVFLLDVREAEKDDLLELLRSQPGLEGAPEIVPSVMAQLTAVDGTPLQLLSQDHHARRYRRERSVTWADRLPAHAEVVEGAWRPEAAEGEVVVSVSEEAARRLQLKLGSSLEFLASGRGLHARVVSVHRTEGFRIGAMSDFMFDPAALQGLPSTFYGGVRMRPSAVPALQRAAYGRFPTVTVVNVADVLSIVQDVVDQIALLIRFISAFTILAGVIILASSVAGTRFRRIREVVILKTLGGTRRRVAGIFSVEFLVIGGLAGLMGSLLASGFAGLLFKGFFEGEFSFYILPNVLATLLTALLATAAGWAASYRILGQKPLEILREE